MHKLGKLTFAGVAAVSFGLATSASAMAATAPAGPRVVTSAPVATHLSVQIQAQLKDAPASVQRWVEGFAEKGQQVLGLASAPYVQKSVTKTNASIRPNDYPVGCGLWVVLTAPSENDIQSSNLTSCDSGVPAYIDMESGIAMLVSGDNDWNEVAHNDASIDNSVNLSLDYSYDCAGTGTHTYQTVTEGELSINGSESEADAYDQINNHACS